MENLKLYTSIANHFQSMMVTVNSFSSSASMSLGWTSITCPMQKCGQANQPEVMDENKKKKLDMEQMFKIGEINSSVISIVVLYLWNIQKEWSKTNLVALARKVRKFSMACCMHHQHSSIEMGRRGLLIIIKLCNSQRKCFRQRETIGQKLSRVIRLSRL